MKNRDTNPTVAVDVGVENRWVEFDLRRDYWEILVELQFGRPITPIVYRVAIGDDQDYIPPQEVTSY